MHILFLDESGTPPKPGKERPSKFVVAGIIIPESIWHSIRDGLHGLKVRHGVRGEIKWRYFAPSNDDKQNPMRALSHDSRNAVRTDIYKLIASNRSVKTLAVVVSSKAAYAMHSVNCQNDIYALAYKAVTERFQYYLQDVGKQTARKEFGLIVSDHRSSSDDNALRGQHQKLVYSTGKNISNYKNIVESLFLCPSHLSIGVQLADLVAGAVWRKYERDDDVWFNHVAPTLRTNSDGKVDGFGLVKMPTKGWE